MNKIKQKRVLFFYSLMILMVFCYPLRAEEQNLEKKHLEGLPSVSVPIDDNDGPLSKGRPTPFERRMAFEKISDFNPFVVLPHKPNYMLPLTYNSSPNRGPFRAITGNEINTMEIKFQLSLKILLVRNPFQNEGYFAFAYTQQSYWQAYQFHQSSPFRETNHEAEFMLTFLKDISVASLKNRMITLGFSHHSNGRAGIFSRSWNRVYADFLLEKGNLLISFKPWFRIPDRSEEDDNPDIEKFYGHGRLMGLYRRGDHTFALTLRNNFRSENRGAIQADWTFPLYSKMNGYLQYFNGYGESLIDYNDSTNRFGFGIMLTNWL